MLFDAYEVGRTLTTPPRTITAADIEQFATLTGDHNPLHLDDEYAAGTIFGRRIAHGLLVQSCAIGLVTDLIDTRHVIAFRALETTFKKPIYIDDLIRVDLTVVDKKMIRRLKAGNVSLDFRVLNSDDEIVQQGRWQLLIKE